jgi:5'-nucleotidase
VVLGLVSGAFSSSLATPLQRYVAVPNQSESRPLFLLSNDDGVRAAGILAAQEALAPLGDVIVAAPDRERSATSHSISLEHPLRAEEIRPKVFAIDGTPVDCVYLALLHLCPRKPDLVISGINHGYNLGSDIFYSGTVAAAVEGSLRGVPGIAVSQERRAPLDFSRATSFLRSLVAQILGRGVGTLPSNGILNVNLPANASTNYEVTFLGRRVYRDLVDVRQDLRGRSYYWIGGPEAEGVDVPGSDMSAIRAGDVSLTPITLDLSNRAFIEPLRSWSLDGWQRRPSVDVPPVAVPPESTTQGKS